MLHRIAFDQRVIPALSYEAVAAPFRAGSSIGLAQGVRYEQPIAPDQFNDSLLLQIFQRDVKLVRCEPIGAERYADMVQVDRI